jgi:hypothetical protein
MRVVMMAAPLSLDIIDKVTGGGIGVHDTPCPLCSALRHSPANRRAKVFRTWRIERGFATYCCVHCGERGAALDRDAAPPDPINLAQARAAAAERDRLHRAERLSLARWLWSIRQQISGTVAERYVRGCRAYRGPIPATLGYLPARDQHSPALVAAFGMATEIEPGVIGIADDDVRGVHLTKLAPDGSGKAGTDCDKVMIGNSAGWPIVLATANDLLGLAVTEGIEDALTAHEATGLGAWAAGSASRLPALAETMPDWINCINVIADGDHDGQRNAVDLTERLRGRGLHVELVGS